MSLSPIRRAFTLIELLIVVIIIGIIAAIALPRFQEVKEQAYAATAISDLRTLMTSMEVQFNTGASYVTNLNCTVGSCSPLNIYTPSTDVRTRTAPGSTDKRGYYASTAHAKLDSLKGRCVNQGDTAGTAPTASAWVNGKPSGAQYSCKSKYF